MTKSAPPLVSAEDVLGFPDAVDALLDLEQEERDVVEQLHTLTARYEVLKPEIRRRRAQLSCAQACRYEEHRATPR